MDAKRLMPAPNATGDCGGDQNTSSTTTGVEDISIEMAKCTLLATLLAVVLIANALMLHDANTSGQSRRWSASLWILKVLACVAILNAIANIAVYLATIVTGRRDEGEILCMLHGLVSSVLLASWTWTLALASWERLVRLTPDHRSLFSKLNTKVIAVGMIVLLLTVYLGPLYGWGEYSFYRGKLSLIVTATNIEQTSTATNSTIPAEQLLQLWNHNTSVDASPVALLRSRLSSLGASSLRPAVTRRGVIQPVRAPGIASLSCLWSHVRSVSGRWYATDDSSYDVHVGVYADEYETYTTVFLPYQDSSMCGLDYSAVNAHAHSFIAFALFCSFVIPFYVIIYVVLRLSCCCRHIRRFSYERRALYDTVDESDEEHVTRIVSYSGVVALLCDVPHLAACLTVGAGIALPPGYYFASSLLRYTQFVFPALPFLLAKRGICSRGAYCDTSWCLPTAFIARRRVDCTLLFDRRNKSTACKQRCGYARTSTFTDGTEEVIVTTSATSSDTERNIETAV